MLNCPFCNSDLSDQGLAGGRCPHCGVVLVWEEEPSPARDESPPVALGSAPGPKEPPGSPPARDGEEGSAARPPAPDTVRTVELPTSSAGPPPDPDSGGGIAPCNSHQKTAPRLGDDTQKVTAIWQAAAAAAPNYYATIKTDQPPLPQSHHLVVRPRQVVEAGMSVPGGADYELLEVIGQGGVGVVYAARQASIDRTVAIKMLRSQEMGNQEQHDKFLAEAVVTGELDHPNIVPVYDLGSNEAGALFYSMKRVQGTPWSRVIHANTLSQNLEILMKVADAVAFAHSRGVIHRDIKPENVMIGDFGEVLVMDWGIALSTSVALGKGGPLKSTSMGGTPAYMAPEMATGPIEKIDTRSDIYLLGAVLFEIIAGYPPHTGDDVMACLLAAARNEIQPTPHGGELMDIARKAMSTQMEDRQETVQDFQRAIRRYQSHNESLALSTQAEKDLEKAKQTQDYQDFARTLFGFEQAIALWRGNVAARRLLAVSKLAYAEAALARNDFDLGLSLLEADNPEHAGLYRTIRTAQEQRNAELRRAARSRRVFAALLGAIFVIVCTGLVVVSYYSYELATTQSQLETKNLELEASIASEREAKIRVQEASTTIQNQYRQLEGLNQNLRTAMVSESRAKEGLADALKTLQATRWSELQQGYVSAISLASVKLDDFITGDARRELANFTMPQVNAFRHWEWGYLMSRCHLAYDERDLPDRVECVACSPTLGWIAVGDTAGNITLWKGQGGQPPDLSQKGRIVRHGEAVFALAFTRDGRYLATGGRGVDGNIKIWDLQADENADGLLCTLTGHPGAVHSLQFDREGKRLLSAGADGSARLWQIDVAARQGRPLRTYAKHLGPVWSAAFAPDEDRIVTAGGDGAAIVWPVENPAGLIQFRSNTGPVYTARISPDGRRVASGGEDGRILLWEPARVPEFDFASLRPRGSYQPVVLAGHNSAVRSLDFSPQGDLLISAGHDNTVCVWDVGGDTAPSDVLARLRAQAGRNLNNEEASATDRIPRQSPGQAGSGDSRLLKTLRGHGGWVRSVSFVTDNARWAVSGGYYQNGQVKLWDIEGYRDPWELHGPSGPIHSLAVSSNGEWLVGAGTSASGEGEIRRWELDQGRGDSLAQGHEYMAMRAAFRSPAAGNSAAAPQLLTVAGDDSLRSWNVLRGGEIYVRRGIGRFGTLAVSADGMWIATGAPGNDARIFQGRDGRPAQVLRGHFGTVTAACFSEEGRWLGTGDANGRAILWTCTEDGQWEARQELMGHAPGRGITAITFLSDRGRVLTASSDGKVATWDTGTGRQLTQHTFLHPAPVAIMACSPDGRLLVTACAVASKARNRFVAYSQATEPETVVTRLYLWDVDAAQIVRTRDLRGQVASSAQFSFDGREVLVAVADDTRPGGWLRRWDVASGQFTPLWPHDPSLGAVWTATYVPRDIIPDAILTVGGKRARLWNASTGALIRDFGSHRSVHSVAISPDDQWVASGGVEGSIKIWSASSRLVARSLSMPHGGKAVVGLAFSSIPGDGQRLFSTGEDGLLRLWDLGGAGEEPGREWPLGDSLPSSLAHSRDGRLLAVGLEDGRVRMLDCTQGHWIDAWETVFAHRERVSSVAFSSDGRLLITGSDDYRAKVFEVASARELMVMEGHAAAVTCVSVSADGRRVVTTSKDETAKIWNIEPALAMLGEQQPSATLSARELLTLRGHHAEVNAVVFAPHGNFLATASNDGRCIIWPADEIVAMRLGTEVREYADGATGPISLVPAAEILTPTTKSLEGWLLDVRIDADDLLPGESLGMEGDGVRVDADGLIHTRDAKGAFVPTARRAPQHLAAGVLQLAWLADATAERATQVVRALTYRVPENPQGDRGVEFRLYPATARRSGHETLEFVLLRRSTATEAAVQIGMAGGFQGNLPRAGGGQ